jgi:hypothetical protein
MTFRKFKLFFGIDKDENTEEKTRDEKLKDMFKKFSHDDILKRIGNMLANGLLDWPPRGKEHA